MPHVALQKIPQFHWGREHTVKGDAGAHPGITRTLTVFISYSRSDHEIAGRLAADLEQRGFKITIDRRSLPFGEHLDQSVTIAEIHHPEFLGLRTDNRALDLVREEARRFET
jgi:hypothetical protein